MLSEPSAGWTNVQIGSWSGPASYITDVPTDCLDALINCLEKHNPQCIYCDAEGWEFTIVVSDFETNIIVSDDKNELFTFDIPAKQLAKELIDDIEKYLGGWISWDAFVEITDKKEIQKQKNILKKKLKKLKTLIEK